TRRKTMTRQRLFVLALALGAVAGCGKDLCEKSTDRVNECLGVTDTTTSSSSYATTTTTSVGAGGDGGGTLDTTGAGGGSTETKLCSGYDECDACCRLKALKSNCNAVTNAGSTEATILQQCYDACRCAPPQKCTQSTDHCESF